jgi:acetyl-CoA carboxylase biotin carboxyl carrier protein
LSLTAKDVAEIMKALDASRFDTLDLELNGVKLQLRRGGAAPATALAPQVPTVHASPVASGGAYTRATVPVEVPPGTTAVAAPLLGIFYRAPKPGEPSFVETGSRVEPDTIVGIIEVMKLMNTVRAGARGEVVAIAARNGELVEHGEALLFVRPD